MTSATTLTAPDGFVIEVQPTSGGDAWLTAVAVASVIAALVAAGGAVLVGYWNRTIGTQAAQAAGESAAAANKAAKASEDATKQVDEWRKREETMRLLRSGAEMAAKAATDSTASLVGLAMLETLREAHNLVQDVDRLFIDQVIDAITDATMAEIGEDDDPYVTPGAYR